MISWMIFILASCKKSPKVDNSSSEVAISVENNSSANEDESTISDKKIDENIPEEITPVHIHSYTSKITNPTCTSIGYTTYTCNCGHSYTDNRKEILGHNYTEWVTVTAATASNTGLEERKCSRCGIKDSREIPKKITNSNIDSAISVTTTVWGNIEYSLKDCIIIDERKWGNPPVITIVDNYSMYVVYYNKNNEKVEFTATQPEFDDYLSYYTILDDGTWVSSYIGAYS